MTALPHACSLSLLLLSASSAPAHAFEPPLWRIEARLHADAALLETRACSDQAQASAHFRAGRGAARFLLDAERGSGGPLQRRGSVLQARDWQAGECLQLRIDLAAAARAERYGIGLRPGQYMRSAVSSWLWRPESMHADSRLHFQLPEGWQASMPWPRASDGSYEAGRGSARRSAIGAFGRFGELRRQVGSTQLRIAVLPGADAVGAEEIADWLGGVARQLALELDGLPHAQLQVQVLPLPDVDRPVPWGEVTRGGGSAVHLLIGAKADQAALRADWTAWHEFSHLLHPYLGERGRWLAEGMASYCQNVLRARSGEFSAEEAWRRLRAGFERGIAATPESAGALQAAAAGRQRGSTMRVYWAGAAFWLETDLQLHAEGDSLSGLLRRYHRVRSPLDCCQQAEAFIAALDALAPAAGMAQRWREYAESRSFPLTGARLDALQLQLRRSDSALAKLLAPAATRKATPL